MNELTCEMCGSNNIVKQDGLYVCQSCNTKYSPEEAKKMMTGEVVEVEGTVKIDNSSELSNLYEVARRAKETNNNENALRYYDQILVKDPNSWEAQFYVVYFRAMGCKIGEIGSVASDIYSCLGPVLELVKDNVPADEQKDVVSEIYLRTVTISEMLFSGARSHFSDISPSVQNRFVQDYVNRAFSCIRTLYQLGNKLVELFGDEYGNLAAQSWKHGIDMHRKIYGFLQDKKGNEAEIESYATKIQKYDPSYIKPEFKSGGCYVATSIYGSYDCPEVWTLRRFRDNTLAKSIHGRMFIKLYYAVSPTVVKYFGDTKVFRNFFKPRLDRLVNKLHEEGVESTYYIGK